MHITSEESTDPRLLASIKNVNEKVYPEVCLNIIEVDNHSWNNFKKKIDVFVPNTHMASKFRFLSFIFIQIQMLELDESFGRRSGTGDNTTNNNRKRRNVERKLKIKGSGSERESESEKEKRNEKIYRLRRETGIKWE